MPSGKDMFTGIHAVLYAFFQRDENIDPGAMTAQVEYCLNAGCDGITVLGLATEVLKLTPSERHRMVEIAGRAVSGRQPFSVTIAGNSVAEQIEMVRVAESNGADWLILQPAMVGSYGADVYLDMFERVADATSLPIAIQNAPAYLGRALSAADIARLKNRCLTFQAVKSEDSALAVQGVIEAAGDDLTILGGRGGLDMIDLLQAGCSGFVLAPDIVPVAVQIMQHWKEGRKEDAANLHAEALPAIAFVMQSLEHLITYGKRIHAEALGIGTFDRAPFLAPSDFGLALARQHSNRLQSLSRG
ncbi:dihydrodipicolinate synthase family protein [Aliiroseovarius sp.]|uniref:dihydrodipicolinate synthase family protein n=1 Tax=Aliiroseovarius sp. TaxID=1872442 RepID=UPI0026314445|nr:dihydrodipicolinate synthase family protein [Aliiroseovarius sp.]